MANLVAASVSKRLVEAEYLHSRTDLFLDSAEQLMNSKLQVDNQDFDNLMIKMEKIIDKMIKKVNFMYEDLGITQKDDWSKDGGYLPAGAAEFKKRFLIDGFFQGD